MVDIKKYISENNKEKFTKYQLIGFIKENGIISGKEKKVLSFSASPVDNLWYEYNNDGNNNTRNKEGKKFDKIKKDNKVPNILIYEKIENN